MAKAAKNVSSKDITWNWIYDVSSGNKKSFNMQISYWFRWQIEFSFFFPGKQKEIKFLQSEMWLDSEVARKSLFKHVCLRCSNIGELEKDSQFEYQIGGERKVFIMAFYFPASQTLMLSSDQLIHVCKSQPHVRPIFHMYKIFPSLSFR